MIFLRREIRYWIVTFEDGHEGAYEEDELRIAEDTMDTNDPPIDIPEEPWPPTPGGPEPPEW